MKVTHVCHLYHPHIGGIENYVQRLVEIGRKSGQQVKVVTNLTSEVKAEKREENIFYGKVLFNFYRNPFSWQIYQHLRQEKDDVYHLHSPWFLSSLLAVLALKKQPKVMTVHSAEIVAKNFLSKILYFIYTPLAKYILNNCDRLICLSYSEKEKVAKKFKIPPEKIQVIPNGIFIKEKKGFDQGNLLKKFGLKSETKKILFISRLVSEKNADRLISSVKKIKSKNLETIIIGGSADEKYLEKINLLKDSSIHILRNLTDDEINNFYQISDLFVFLGTWEGLPTVLLEAMLHGLPVISTDVGGIPELITEKKNGFLIKHPIDLGLLADKIKKILSDADLSETMRKNNVQKIKREYDFENLAEKIFNIYNYILKNGY